MPYLVSLNLLFRAFSVVNDNMKDLKPHFFERGTFVCMSYIKSPCNKIKNSLVHRRDFHDFVNMVREWAENRKIITNPGLWAKRLFFGTFFQKQFDCFKWTRNDLE